MRHTHTHTLQRDQRNKEPERLIVSEVKGSGLEKVRVLQWGTQPCKVSLAGPAERRGGEEYSPVHQSQDVEHSSHVRVTSAGGALQVL